LGVEGAVEVDRFVVLDHDGVEAALVNCELLLDLYERKRSELMCLPVNRPPQSIFSCGAVPLPTGCCEGAMLKLC
jgi:hypothetical protein